MNVDRRLLVVALLVTASCFLQPVAAAPFIRGDTDGSGTLELTDPLRTFGHLFLGSPSVLGCPDAADVDDSGLVQLTDGVYSLNHLFLGTSPPAMPYPDCGSDPTADEAFVSVNERGTEAAAATAVTVGVTSVPPPVFVDRPFVFVIRDVPSGTILFLGRVLDPAS